MPVRRCVALATCLAMTACATRPDNISATYVSPVTYQSMSCAQLAEERARVSGELARLVDLQYQNANADAMMVAVGVVFVPIVALGLFATKDRKVEIGQLKGQDGALAEAMRAKQCAMSPAATPATVAAPATVVAPGGKPTKCKDVGGYESYKAKTGQLCEI
jgi:hypothetical protein